MPPQIPTSSLEPQTTPEEKSWGPIIGSIIIVVIIVAGGIYIWGSRLAPLPSESANTPDAETEALKLQSSSDDLNSISRDLNATNLDSLDKGVENVGKLQTQ